MADTASDAGVGARAFSKLLAGIAADPALAFEELRALLFDVSTRLLAARGAQEAAALLVAREMRRRRFAPLLHQYALSTWVLYAHAFAPRALAPRTAIRKLHAVLRAAPSSLDWLAARWLMPRAQALSAAR
jgi:hypothetical protein